MSTDPHADLWAHLVCFHGQLPRPDATPAVLEALHEAEHNRTDSRQPAHDRSSRAYSLKRVREVLDDAELEYLRRSKR